MKYYINDATGAVYLYQSDGSQDEYILPELRPMTPEEIAVYLDPPLSQDQRVFIENQWREVELVTIANQLLSIEEAEAAEEEGEPAPPDLLHGTRNQWLSYRTKVRSWREGNPEFPGTLLRPERPV